MMTGSTAPKTTYRRCCGSDCIDAGNPDEPCWGDVSVMCETKSWGDEGHWWAHACEGHAPEYKGEAYIPPPPGCLTLHLSHREDA